MTANILEGTPRPPQGGPPWPRSLPRGPQEAQIFETRTRKSNLCCLAFRLISFDARPGAIDCSRRAQCSPKRSQREARDGSNSTEGRPQWRSNRGRLANLGAPEGEGGKLKAPVFLGSISSNVIPRGAPKAPESEGRGPRQSEEK
eukprot:2974683-Pyramimonas_sp.AAC.2